MWKFNIYISSERRLDPPNNLNLHSPNKWCLETAVHFLYKIYLMRSQQIQPNIFINLGVLYLISPLLSELL